MERATHRTSRFAGVLDTERARVRAAAYLTLGYQREPNVKEIRLFQA